LHFPVSADYIINTGEWRHDKDSHYRWEMQSD